MTWESLSKIYRKNNSNEEILASVYSGRFNSPFTKKLNFDIKQQGRKNAWQTFFYYTDEMVELLTKIMQETTKLKLQKQYLPDIALESLYFSNMVDEIIATNAIEGVNSSKREISKAMDKQKNKNPKNVRFWFVVNKYKKLTKQSMLSFDTCRDIRVLYDEFVLDVVKEENATDLPDGEIFRKGQVSVGSGAVGKDDHQGVYPEEKIIEAMTNALTILHDQNIEALIRIAIFHYLFGYIHPFYNGNGRMSRFISSYYLSNMLESIMGYRLSYTIKENINKYYKSFKIVNEEINKADITPFISTYLDFIKEAEINLRDGLIAKGKSLERFSRSIEKLPNGLDE